MLKDWPIEFARMAFLSYPVSGDSSEREWELTLNGELDSFAWTLQRVYDVDGGESFLATKGLTAVVAIRGTQLKSWADLYADLKSMKNDGEGGIGFRRRAKSLLDAGLWMDAKRLRGEGYSICLVGHSLGGAIANVVALELDPMCLVTYGSPRALSVANAERLEGRVDRIARFCNLRDPVPLFPSRIKIPWKANYGGFAHAGKTQWFDARGDFKADYSDVSYMLGRLQQAIVDTPAMFMAALRNHSMSDYLIRSKENSLRIERHFRWGWP